YVEFCGHHFSVEAETEDILAAEEVYRRAQYKADRGRGSDREEQRLSAFSLIGETLFGECQLSPLGGVKVARGVVVHGKPDIVANQLIIVGRLYLFRDGFLLELIPKVYPREAHTAR